MRLEDTSPLCSWTVGYVLAKPPSNFAVQVLAVAWLISTTFFVICYASPCTQLPPKAQLQFFELGGDDQDIFAAVDDTDARGLKHFPRMW